MPEFSQEFKLVLFIIVPYFTYRVCMLVLKWMENLNGMGVVTAKMNPDVYFKYGVSAMQGKRPYMEDRHSAMGPLNGDKQVSFYAVFDGHGGSFASEYCMNRMGEELASRPNLSADPATAMTETFATVDEEYLQLAEKMNRDDGTTVIAMLVQGNDICVANAGDSRAILIQQHGRIVELSEDHKPNRPDERKRISDLGGAVVFWGVWRVEGILALSRAIGDRMLKQYVTSTPDIVQRTIQDADAFAVLASDGVWDVLTNEEVGRFVIDAPNVQMASKVIMEMAYSRGSTDNICALVIDLKDHL